MFKIYNSLSRKKELLPKVKKLRLFVCGPTVYDYAHLGHARTYIFFDFFVKYLRSLGRKVFYLQNVTDIDDKIIKRAANVGKSPKALAAQFIEEYSKDMKALGVNAVSKYAHATKFIPQIVNQVERLVKRRYAYKIEGDGYYFDIKKFPDYGKLSRRTALQADDAVSRIDESVDKRNRGDFCLWKLPSADIRGLNADLRGKKFTVLAGEPIWKTPLGWGRPGWHIEDTAISEHYFGPKYDIHGGGLDLKFPHHEAEIAQQEAASGKKPFVRIWMHTGMLIVNGEKMSKSLGNFITIRDFLKKHRPEVLRFIMLNYHYRSPLNYTEKLAKEMKNKLSEIESFVVKLGFIEKSKKTAAKAIKIRTDIRRFSRHFNRALADDFNTAQAIASIFALMNKAQPFLWRLSRAEASNIRQAICNNLKNIGLEIKSPEIPRKIVALAKKREKYRTNKQFIQSDLLRKKINRLGYEVEDTPLGPFIWPSGKS